LDPRKTVLEVTPQEVKAGDGVKYDKRKSKGDFFAGKGWVTQGLICGQSNGGEDQGGKGRKEVGGLSQSIEVGPASF